MYAPYARWFKHAPDAAFPLVHAIRRQAIARLHLKLGDRVLDVGSGWGMSLPGLRAAVGDSGEVIGIEVSPLLAARCRERIADNGWKNVSVVEGDAHTVVLPGEFDAMLLFAVHEVTSSPAALDHLMTYCKPGARVVAFGAKLTDRPIGRLANRFFRFISAKWLPVSVPIDAVPWRALAERIPGLEVEERAAGVMYLAWGTK